MFYIIQRKELKIVWLNCSSFLHYDYVKIHFHAQNSFHLLSGFIFVISMSLELIETLHNEGFH